MFAASDIDLKTFTDDMLPRLYDLPRDIIVTINENDGTLGVSEFFYGASRIGKPNADELTEEDLERIAQAMQEKLIVIDVSDAIGHRGKGDSKGHGYWYRNDWVSTEVLAAVGWDVPPGKRGLERRENGLYRFPNDYPARVADNIIKVNEGKIRRDQPGE
jgi:esterase/lipase superfamily enzyme